MGTRLLSCLRDYTILKKNNFLAIICSFGAFAVVWNWSDNTAISFYLNGISYGFLLLTFRIKQPIQRSPRRALQWRRKCKR